MQNPVSQIDSRISFSPRSARNCLSMHVVKAQGALRQLPLLPKIQGSCDLHQISTFLRFSWKFRQDIQLKQNGRSFQHDKTWHTSTWSSAKISPKNPLFESLLKYEPWAFFSQGTTCLPSGSFSRSVFQCSACSSCQDVNFSSQLKARNEATCPHFVGFANLCKSNDHFSQPAAGDFLHPWTSRHHIACNPVAAQSRTRPAFCLVEIRSQHSKSFQVLPTNLHNITIYDTMLLLLNSMAWS